MNFKVFITSSINCTEKLYKIINNIYCYRNKASIDKISLFFTKYRYKFNQLLIKSLLLFYPIIFISKFRTNIFFNYLSICYLITIVTTIFSFYILKHKYFLILKNDYPFLKKYYQLFKYKKKCVYYKNITKILNVSFNYSENYSNLIIYIKKIFINIGHDDGIYDLIFLIKIISKFTYTKIENFSCYGQIMKRSSYIEVDNYFAIQVITQLEKIYRHEIIKCLVFKKNHFSKKITCKNTRSSFYYNL